jgi:hypothetical protein
MAAKSDGSSSRCHSGRRMIVSYSLRPSVNQRGTWLFDIWIANTCPSSCQSTLPQLNGAAAGLIAASV